MKILLFLCPWSKYDLNVANLMTKKKKEAISVCELALLLKVFIWKTDFTRTVEWEAL